MLRYGLIVRDAHVEVIFLKSQQAVDIGPFELPTECKFLLDPDVWPMGVDERSFHATMSTMIAYGFEEARARENSDDPYVPFETLVLPECVVKTIDMVKQLSPQGVWLGSVHIVPEKILRAFQRLRKCGHVAFSIRRNAAAA